MAEPRRRVSQRVFGTGVSSAGPGTAPARRPYEHRGIDAQKDPKEIAAEVRQRLAAKLIGAAPSSSAVPDICHLGAAPDLPDAGPCCMGWAVYGPHRCTCWVPVYDLEQQDPQGGHMGLRAEMCHDCAFRPNSPERRGEAGYQGSAEDLNDMVTGGSPFACHQGIRRPVKWVHPSGAEIPGHPADYSPPIVNGTPYKADGTPADLCAGWAARRLKEMDRQRREAS